MIGDQRRRYSRDKRENKKKRARNRNRNEPWVCIESSPAAYAGIHTITLVQGYVMREGQKSVGFVSLFKFLEFFNASGNMKSKSRKDAKWEKSGAATNK